jgi:starch-binding outer membrane protein, SusD/RagB family
MKKYIYLYVWLMAGIALSSCEDRLREILPRTAIAPEAVASAQDVERLLIGAYDGHQSGGAGASFNYLGYLTEDLSADNLQWRATFFQHGEVDRNTILPENVLVQRYWIYSFVANYRTNEILEIIQGLDAAAFPAGRRDQIIGEAHYLRAYAYYRLVTLFGGVPIAIPNTLEPIPRNTEEEVWNQIVADLNMAIDLAPTFTNREFASKESARALLARVHLIRQNWAEARDLAEEVINSGRFTLAADYASIFRGGAGTSEIIMQLTNTETEAESFHGFFLLDQDPYNPFGTGGRLELPVHPSLIAAYEPGDVRRDASIAPARPGFYQALKYPSGGTGDDPFYINRISEMYLISAEASAEAANSPAAGIGRLNELRAVRGLGPVAPGSMDAFRDAVLHERRVELAFEGVRWTDLKRTGRAIEVLPNVTSPNQLLYPVPTTELDVNPNLVQNPGYN